MPQKPTLLQLRRQYNITSGQIAKAAGLPLYQSYTVDIGGFTRKDIAEKVLSAFSLLVEKQYRLSDIQIREA